MKLSYKLDRIKEITSFNSKHIQELLEYFYKLPIEGKIEIFVKMKDIEEDNENAFFLQYFNLNEIGEYRFSIFLLSLSWLYEIEKKNSTSPYLKNKPT